MKISTDAPTKPLPNVFPEDPTKVFKNTPTTETPTNFFFFFTETPKKIVTEAPTKGSYQF